MFDSKQFKQGINDEQSYMALSFIYCELTSNKEFTKSFLKQVTETLNSKKIPGTSKFYALRLLRDCVATNKSAIVNDLANSRDLLSTLKEFALFQKGNQSDDRGSSIFEKTDPLVGNHFLRLVLECLFTWADKFKKDSKGNPTRFRNCYQDLLDQKVKFPSEFIFYPQITKKKSQDPITSSANLNQSQIEKAASQKSSKQLFINLNQIKAQPLGKSKKLSKQDIDDLKIQYNNFCSSFFSELSVIQETLQEAQEPEEFIQDILDSYINIFQGTLKSLDKLIPQIIDIPEFSLDEKNKLDLISQFILKYNQLVAELKKSGFILKKYTQFQKTILSEVENFNLLNSQEKQIKKIQQEQNNFEDHHPVVSQKSIQQTEISKDQSKLPSAREISQIDNTKKQISQETPAWEMNQTQQNNQDHWAPDKKFEDFTQNNWGLDKKFEDFPKNNQDWNLDKKFEDLQFGEQRLRSEISDPEKISQRGQQLNFSKEQSKLPSAKEINYLENQKQRNSDAKLWDFNQIPQNNEENWGIDKKLEDFQFGEQKQRSEVSLPDKFGIEDQNFDFTQMSQIFFQSNEQNKLSFGNEKEFVDKQLGFNDFDFGQFNPDKDKKQQPPSETLNAPKKIQTLKTDNDLQKQSENQTKIVEKYEQKKEEQSQKQINIQKELKEVKKDNIEINKKTLIQNEISEDNKLQIKQTVSVIKAETRPNQNPSSPYNVQDEQQSHKFSMDLISNLKPKNSDEFSEKFDALSLSTLSVHDFPMKNQTLEEKRQYSGYIITYNPFSFNFLENYRLNATQIRRLKIGCFKTRAAIFVSPELEIGVISKFLYHEVTSKYFLKLTLVIGNKSQKPLLNCQIQYYGDNSQSLWVQPLRQPKKDYQITQDSENKELIVHPKKQIFQDIVIQYHHVPFQPMEAVFNWQDDVNQMKANFILPTFLAKFMKFTNFVNYSVFKNRWHLKRYSILRSEIIKFNSKIIRHPTTFKKYFPDLTELSSLQDFIQQQQGNKIKDYKLGGIFVIQTSQIEFMLKIIVRPNLTGLFKIIASSTYQLLTENILHNLVFIFGMPKQ